MKKITFATVVSSALAALAIGLAGPALADAGSGSIVPAPGPSPCTRIGLRWGEPVHAVRRRSRTSPMGCGRRTDPQRGTCLIVEGSP